jgi:signal transduction histidine kinase
MAELKILVVDDEPGIRSGVSRILRNFRVTYPFMDDDFTYLMREAGSGEEGIEIIEEWVPDILLLDNKLPGIQGVEVLEYVRNRNYDMVVAMITSYASLDVAVRATRNGASDFIPKPFTPQELKSSIENISKQLYLRRITSRMKQEGKKIRYQFLSVLSHELKSPLNAIEGYLKIMYEKGEGESIDNYIPMIERSIKRIQGMRNLILDLLDFTKIRFEIREDKVKEVKLGEICENALGTIQPYAIQKDVELHKEVRSEITMMADPDDLEMICNNLLSNAVKYNRDGGRVDIVMDSDDRNAVISVSDTGIGMSEEEMGMLFNEFVRIRNEQTKNILGSGLGLSIVKKVVELYKGSIDVDSRPGEGSTFTVRLPLKI